MSSAFLTRFSPSSPDTAGEIVAGCVGPGTPTHHLHAEWQFAVPGTATGLSLGAFQRFGVRTGDLTVVPPFTVHSEARIADSAETWHILYVSSRALARLNRPAKGGGDRSHLFTQPVVHDPDLAEGLRELLRPSTSQDLGHAEFARRARSWLEQVLGKHASAVQSMTPRTPVERARAYLQGQPGRTVGLAETAAAAGTSARYLASSFTRAVGLSPQRYHSHVRLAHARRLLSEGQSASQVTYECGFADQSHLNRCFKARYGITPGSFQALVEREEKSACRERCL